MTTSDLIGMLDARLPKLVTGELGIGRVDCV